jgi:predicted dehydrogenase
VSARHSPSVRITVIGSGHWGPNLIRNFYDASDSHVVWVVDLDESRLAEVESRFPGVRTTSDAELAIADPDVDAVVVATPATTHFALAKSALEHGKHVLVEKPITTDVASAEALCELAEQRGLVLMVGQVFLYNTAVRRVRAVMDAGELGRVYYISMVRTNLGPIRLDVDASWDLAAHDLSIATYWLGSEPVTASAMGGSWINAGIDDAVFAVLGYPGDVLVSLHSSWLNPRKVRDITVVGDHKMLTLDDMNLTEPIRIYDKQVTESLVGPGFVDSFASFRASIREGDITIPNVALGEPLKAECREFVECILSGARPTSGGREGLSVVKALEAIQRSMKNRGREEPVG